MSGVSAVTRAGIIGMLACAAFPLFAQDPAQLLGTSIQPLLTSNTDPHSSRRVLSDEEIDHLLDLPSADGLGNLMKARVISLQRRGAKDVSVNKKLAPATVFIQGDSTCTGTLISADGKILTCWHCVRGKDTVAVRLHPSSGETRLLVAKVLRTDPSTDLALLQLPSPPANIKPLPLGDESEIQVGADVYAVGHPSGLSWSFVKGLISQVYEKRVWEFERNRHEAEVILSQISLYEGNSGGPLVSEGGRLIGVNSSRREKEQFTFAISLPEIKRFVGASQTAAVRDAVKQASSKHAGCERKKTGEGRSADGQATVIYFDTDCDGIADTTIRVPLQADEPIVVAQAGRDGRVKLVRSKHRDGDTLYLGGRNREAEPIKSPVTK